MRLSNRLPSFVLVDLFVLPAAAQTSVELFREDFESAATRWTMEARGTSTSRKERACRAFLSGTHAAWYGRKYSSFCSYNETIQFRHLSL